MGSLSVDGILTMLGSVMFGNETQYRWLIHIPENSKTINAIYNNTTATTSIIDKAIIWTNSGSNFYNTAYNIYIYTNASI